MKKIVVRGPALSRSGYGEHVRFLLRSLKKYHEHDIDLFVDNTKWGQCGQVPDQETDLDWIMDLVNKTEHLRATGQKLEFDLSLQVTIPGEFEKLAKLNIGITAGVETTKVSPQWLMKCNQMDKIITISEFAKSSLVETTYDTQAPDGTIIKDALRFLTDIEVVHYPARKLSSKIPLMNLNHDFNFLTIAQLSPRKKVPQLIKCFVEEFFHEEVGLIVKTMGKNNSVIDRAGVERVLSDFLKGSEGRKCSVYLLHGEMSEEEIQGLYTFPKIKAFVTTSSGEGFGLPLFEAAQAGLPIIAIPWSGPVDFLFKPEMKIRKSKTGKSKKIQSMKGLFTKIDFNLNPVEPEAVWDTVIQKDSKWAFAEDKSVRKCLRDVLTNIEAKVAMAEELQEHVSVNFEENKQLKAFSDAIFCPKISEVLFADETVEDDDWESDLDEIEIL